MFAEPEEPAYAYDHGDDFARTINNQLIDIAIF